jgi:hypothetical protein
VKAITYFEHIGVNVVAFLPQSYVRRKPYEARYLLTSTLQHHNTAGSGRTSNALMETDEWEKLEQLAVENKLSLVPPGDKDDAYILSYARENDAFVVSNDLFMDHMRRMEENGSGVRRSMANWLRLNRCAYTFVGHEFYISPSR